MDRPDTFDKILNEFGSMTMPVCDYCGGEFKYLNLVASGVEICDVCAYSHMDTVERGSKPIKGSPKPKYTVWKQKTVRNQVRQMARSRRRSFKQYIKSGSLSLLRAAEKKITRWDFD